MFSAWGFSWGPSWGYSWGAVADNEEVSERTEVLTFSAENARLIFSGYQRSARLNSYIRGVVMGSTDRTLIIPRESRGLIK